jgi:hypothetical protein
VRCDECGSNVEQYVQVSGKLLKDGDQLLAPESILTSQREKVPGLGRDDPSLRFPHDGDAPTTSELQDSFVSKNPQGPQHRVWVDP